MGVNLCNHSVASDCFQLEATLNIDVMNTHVSVQLDTCLYFFGTSSCLAVAVVICLLLC